MDHNATQAAIRAGYSAHTAHVQASRLLANVKVQALIAEMKVGAAERADERADDVLQELRLLGHSDIGDYFETGAPDDAVPRIKALKDWSPGARRAVQSVKVRYFDPIINRKGEVLREGFHLLELKLHPKIPALELLGRATGAFPDKPADAEGGKHYHLHVYGTDGYEKTPEELAGKTEVH